jgi:hypothetical protein
MTMTRLKLSHALVACAVALGPTRSSADDSKPEVDIRSEDGAVFLAADKILSCDWTTHTLTLAPKAREELAAGLRESKRLVAGIPFGVAVGGKVVYSGTFTSIVSSKSFATPVVLVDPVSPDAKTGKDQLQIQLGYPTAEFFKGEDPRGDKRIRAALKTSRKLVEAELTHPDWLAKAMREIATVKPGMTREELLKVCEEEGGLSTRTQRTYVYRGSLYIKVDVTFEGVGDAGELGTSLKDKVVKISKPYLNWSIAD